MKRSYVAPTLEVELYQLDQAIANNCGTVVHNGPSVPELGINQCEDFVDPYAMFHEGMTTMSIPKNVNFYLESGCDCYTTGSDGTFWTS